VAPVELRVQQVVMPSGVDSATVLRGVTVHPVDRLLAHLTAIDRSPNTVRAYAHDVERVEVPPIFRRLPNQV
jgi:integrase/recombinase XerD